MVALLNFQFLSKDMKTNMIDLEQVGPLFGIAFLVIITIIIWYASRSKPEQPIGLV